MTRRNFIALARILAKYENDIPTEVHINLVNDFANECKKFNSVFNIHRFTEAARPGGK